MGPFNGNVMLGASATMRVNVDGNLQMPGGPGTYDKIIVSGAGNTFAAGGTLMPVLRAIPGGKNDFIPTLGSPFGFLNAINGASVTGQFAGLTQPLERTCPEYPFRRSLRAHGVDRALGVAAQ